MPHPIPNCFLPESGDYDVFKEAVLDCIIVDVPSAIRCALTDAGFVVGRQIGKTLHHPVFEFSIQRTADMQGQNEKQLKRRIRKALRAGLLYKNAKETYLTFTFRAQKIVCGFVCKLDREDEPEPLDEWEGAE